LKTFENGENWYKINDILRSINQLIIIFTLLTYEKLQKQA